GRVNILSADNYTARRAPQCLRTSRVRAKRRQPRRSPGAEDQGDIAMNVKLAIALPAALSLGLLVAACNKNDAPPPAASTTTTSSTPAPADASAPAASTPAAPAATAPAAD